MEDNLESLLLVNDVCGYGRVSTFAMLPVLAHYGLHPYVLPTALVSNTLDYGTSEILDTSDFMKRTIRKWDELGFKFNCISTGFINSGEQASIIIDLIEAQDSPLVFVDPIMADDGRLYPDMYKGAIESNRKLASKATVIMPNFTEALMISGLFFDGRTFLTKDEYKLVIDKICELGPKNIVIKSCIDNDAISFNLVYDTRTNSITKLEYEYIPTPFIGTGDIFASVLISEYLCGKSLIEAVRISSNFVCDVIKANNTNEDRFDIRHEKCLHLLNIK